MELAVHLSGQLPARWEQALALLREDLLLAAGPTGMDVCCRRGEALTVESDGRSVRLQWSKPVEFYRALSLIPQPLVPCVIREQAGFETAGVMFDCSRNAVLKPEALRFFLRKMALMGLNLAMLYTEDTYEVPGQPFFGYQRGRYTFDELQALDDYADALGIELCPCIQTLGHLKRILHWPVYRPLRDNEEVLLADLEETYTLLEQMIRAAAAPYRSRRIHLGMDEAHGVGLGEHLRRFGYENPHAVMGRHLRRVLDIAERCGLRPMIWSDMYFRLDGRDYHSPGLPSKEARAAVDPRVTLVYWDYYENREEAYADALRQHAQFPAPTVFAGGIWTWIGPAPDYPTAFANSVAGLTACRKAGIPLVLATAWGDNGAETNLTAGLLGLQLYGEMTYTGVFDQDALFARFRRCCSAEAQDFWDLSLLNRVPGLEGRPSDPVNACKFLLYQDPLVQLFEADTAGLDLAGHFAALAPRYAQAARKNPTFQLLFTFYEVLAQALASKCLWHEQAGPIVRRGDRVAAARLAADVPAIVDALTRLRRIWRQLWESTNTPHGFEVLELRLAGVTARMETAGEKLCAFADGTADTIPELTAEPLPFLRRDDGTAASVNNMDEIATASCLNW